MLSPYDSTLFAALAFSTAACVSSQSATEREERPRIKAVELYSWENESGEWTFALLDGTNRIKSSEEVRSAPDRYVGVEALEEALAGLAEGESVFWSHHAPGFTFPDNELRSRIVEAGRAKGVEIWDGGPDAACD